VNIYLAGPLFTAAEIDFNAALAGMIREAGHNVFLPQESENKERRVEEIFRSDINGIDWADVVIANMDGADPDSGTAWECGYAFAKDKTLLLFRTDFRQGGDGSDAPYNLMLAESADKVLDLRNASTEDVASAIVEALAAYKP
jgi:nucleoside 2-deoxyribosyltransferase